MQLEGEARRLRTGNDHWCVGRDCEEGEERHWPEARVLEGMVGVGVA